MSIPASDPKCPNCGTSKKPRLDLESGAIRERLLSDYDSATREEIEAMVSLVDQEYQDCVTEIERLQFQLRSLSYRQQQLKLCGLELRSLLSPSPIRKLPNEVLMNVFDYVSQDNLFREERNLGPSNLWSDDEHGLTTMPAMVLSSVCTRWRQISLSYSAIWSRMSLMVRIKSTYPEFDGLMTMLKLYIDRSGTSLLRFRIETSGRNIGGDVTHHALSLLGQYSHRWQHLTFIGDHYLSRKIFSLPPDIHNFPMLEELMFDSTTRYTMDIFGQAPKLWSLVVENEFVLAFSGISEFPSWQLTSLDVACDKGLKLVVDRCPNLISLRIRLGFNVDILHQESRALCSLKSLSVVINDAKVYVRHLDAVLSSFICPALTSLMVERQLAPMVEATWPLQALKSFLTQSLCTLNSLSIKGLQLSDNDFVTVLKQLPSLTSLVIEDHPGGLGTITPSLIQSLHSSNSSTLRPSSDPPLLPQLQHLSLAYTGKTFDDAIIIDMIESRCLPILGAERQGIDPLRSLVLKSLDRTPDKRVEEIYEPLRKLEEAGFKLVVIFQVKGVNLRV